MKNSWNNMKMGPRLITLFLLVGLIPMGISAWQNMEKSAAALEVETQNKLSAIGTIKAGQIEGWFGERFGDVEVLGSLYEIADAVQRYDEAYHAGGPESDSYKSVQEFYDPVLRNYMEKYGYYDVFLIGNNGDVVYTVCHELDFATNLVNGQYRSSGLAEAFQGARNGRTVLTDFAPYAPSAGTAASFIACPITAGGELVGVVALQMPLGAINAVMQEQTGLGESGETYLVGQDYKMRSDSRFSQESTVLKQEIRTAAAEAALAGRTDCEVVDDYRGIPVYSYYRALEIEGLEWVLLCEIDEVEAMAPVSQIRKAVFLMVGLASLIILALAWWLARGISTPLAKMAGVATEFATGNVDLNVDIKRGDEIGSLAQAFRDMIKVQQEKAENAEMISRGDLATEVTILSDKDVLGKAMTMVKEAIQRLVSDANLLTKAALAGELDTRADDTKHNGEYQQIVQGMNETLDAVLEPISEAGDALQLLANYDLRARVTGDYHGGHAKIKDALNATADALHDAMEQVTEGSGQVAAASVQIAKSSQMVAEGASEQASSLEETSASLEEMAGMTKQNADNTQEARALSESTKESAAKGNAAMEEMLDSMGKIRAAAEGTAEIINDINSIAFQTNLLALNAAVEAARAGDAGRGFAVVAEEVRNLAGRAKEAAKNTEDLIKESVSLAEHGETISKEVGENLGSMAESVGKVTDIIGEIAVASREQTSGIDQVNTAVTEMDKTVQQAAANSEESSSAAQELASQAQEMTAMVGRFQLNRSGSKPSAPAPSAGTTVKPQVRKQAPAPKAPVSQKSNDLSPEDLLPMEDDLVLAEF